jgi:hypothetical protein
MPASMDAISQSEQFRECANAAMRWAMLAGCDRDRLALIKLALTYAQAAACGEMQKSPTGLSANGASSGRENPPLRVAQTAVSGHR